MQQIAWTVSLTLMGIIPLLFLWVTMGASRPQPPGNPFRMRGAVFWVTVITGLAITFATLAPWPMAAQYGATNAPDVVIQATGHQWRWELSQDTVQVGQEVEFQVTSADVNHGFAIYRNKTQLLTQTQAMPGYVNRLGYTFTETGEYEVLCLEYCGLAHHAMVAKIIVR